MRLSTRIVIPTPWQRRHPYWTLEWLPHIFPLTLEPKQLVIARRCRARSDLYSMLSRLPSLNPNRNFWVWSRHVWIDSATLKIQAIQGRDLSWLSDAHLFTYGCFPPWRPTYWQLSVSLLGLRGQAYKRASRANIAKVGACIIKAKILRCHESIRLFLPYYAWNVQLPRRFNQDISGSQGSISFSRSLMRQLERISFLSAKHQAKEDVIYKEDIKHRGANDVSRSHLLFSRYNSTWTELRPLYSLDEARSSYQCFTFTVEWGKIGWQDISLAQLPVINVHIPYECFPFCWFQYNNSSSPKTSRPVNCIGNLTIVQNLNAFTYRNGSKLRF